MASDPLTNWLTVALGVATAWMAWETRRMAKASEETLKLSAQPALALERFDVEPMRVVDDKAVVVDVGLRPSVTFTNPGAVRVTYDVLRMDFGIGGAQYPAKNFANHLGVVFPKGEATFFHPFIKWPGTLAAGMSGTLELEVQYWGDISQRYALKFGVRFTIVALDASSRRIEWIYLHGPSYTEPKV